MDTNKKKKLGIVIPCYNEEENVIPICTAVEKVIISELVEYDYEILLIDNCSTDNTRDLIRKLCKDNHKIKAIFNARNFGQFNSPYHGICQSDGDCTIEMVADFQDPVDLIPILVKEWENGRKIVCAVKNTSQENKIVRALRTVYYKLIKRMSSVEQIEHFTGTGLYDRSFVEVLRNLKDPLPFLRGIVAELGFSVGYVYYDQPKRRAGKTHNNFFTLYDATMLSFTSYTNGMRVATFFGFICAVLSFFIGVGFLIAKLINWNGFTVGVAPIIISIFFIGGILLLFLGILGEYVIFINKRVINRPLVIEEERINFNQQND